jgi:hypothetical protein
MHTIFWSKNIRGVDHSENLEVYKKIILEGILEKQDGKLCTGFNWLRIGSIGRLW